MIGRIGRYLSGDDRGAVLVTAAISLVAIIAAGALALDLGMTLVERRSARNAADHAALAAAWANCNGEVPADAANASVTRNGYTSSNLTLSEPASDTFHALVITEVRTNFAGVIGFNTVEVTGSATASCTGGGGSANAIFAGGECSAFGKPTLEINGSTQTVYGGIHSNDNVTIPGSNNDFGPGNPSVDPFTYSGNGAAFQDGGSGNLYDPDQPKKIAVQEWPILFELADYQPGSANALAAGSDYHHIIGDLTGEDIQGMGDGLYYVEGGNVDFDKDYTGSVTIVAEGTIKVSAEVDLTPYVDNLVLYSDFLQSGDKLCTEPVVQITGSNSNWTGLIYGPGGLVEFNGSTNTDVNGSAIGYAVRLNGSNLTIIADPSFFAGDPDTKLLK